MKYLVPETGNPSKFVTIEASGFVPENSIPLPLELYGEEDEWLVVKEVEGEFGEPIKQVEINESLKTELLQKRAEAEALAAREQKAKRFLQESDFEIFKIIEKFLKTQDLSPEEAKIISDREKARLELENVKNARELV